MIKKLLYKMGFYKSELSIKFKQLLEYYRLARKCQLSWEKADMFDYKEQNSEECSSFCEQFNNETEFIIKNLGK